MSEPTHESEPLSEQQSAQYQAAALLALHASRGQPPRGPQPDTEELALLLEDRLSFTRKQEIYSHLNATPALYQQWLLMVENGHPAESTQCAEPATLKARPLRWQRWFAAAGALVGIAAVLLIAPWRTVPPQTSLPAEIAEQPKAAHTQVLLAPQILDALSGIQHGLASGDAVYYNRLTAIVSNAPETPVETPFFAFGEALAQLHNQCAASNATGRAIDSAIEMPLRQRIQQQALALEWPASPLSLTMASMGIDDDLCALSDALRNEILQFSEGP